MNNYHTHCHFCDGADSPEELVEEALRLGCTELGFSSHSPIAGEDDWTLTEEKLPLYKAEIRRLQQKYEGRIHILLGLEQDLLSGEPDDDFDFIIGAVHHVIKDGRRLSVDHSRERFLEIAREVYQGDFLSFAEDYYQELSRLPELKRCDIIAHFDLITKYNEGDCLFSTSHPRYRLAAERALENVTVIPGAKLEINTGAMARGYRLTPYPQDFLIRRWKDMGKPLILSSDCHDRRYLLYDFDHQKSKL